MKINELYTEVSNHLLQGIMNHEQLSNFYDYLGLTGYAKCHEYHYLSESCNYRKLQKWYIDMYDKVIPESKIENESIIPNTWYTEIKQNTTFENRQDYIKFGFEFWINWEESTKKLFERACRDCLDMGELSSIFIFAELLNDVNAELKEAKKNEMERIATDFDINEIVEEQKSFEKKYKKLIEKIGESLC